MSVCVCARVCVRMKRKKLRHHGISNDREARTDNKNKNQHDYYCVGLSRRFILLFNLF